MNLKTLMRQAKKAIHNQRGVTLIELILVVALLTLVFGGIVTLLTSMYKSYEQTNEATTNERQATMIINQLVQDIRKSIQPKGEDEAEPVFIDEENKTIVIVTKKQASTAPQTIEYRYEGGKIVYVTDQQEVELAPNGELKVVPLDEAECQTGACYELTVVVGEGEGQASLTTQVALYDWREYAP